ncbi:MAG: hypothetical protein IPK13_16115 [Deltaproteobacteria bacterium]|nr:hypothetical protein [Deltaproteobacteria bacterium]
MNLFGRLGGMPTDGRDDLSRGQRGIQKYDIHVSARDHHLSFAGPRHRNNIETGLHEHVSANDQNARVRLDQEHGSRDGGEFVR